MKIAIFYPVLLIVHIEYLDRKIVKEALLTSLIKFRELVKPVPAMYKDVYKQHLRIKSLQNDSWNFGSYTYVHKHVSKILEGTIYVNEIVEDRNQIFSTLVHEFIHALTVQVLGRGISLPLIWVVREGIAELASLESLSAYCKNVAIFSYETLLTKGGYTEAAVFVAYYQNISPDLIGMYLFCIKLAIDDTKICNENYVSCVEQPERDCDDAFESCKMNNSSSYLCNGGYQKCLLKVVPFHSSICKFMQDNCMRKIENRCTNIVRPYFSEPLFKKFVKSCSV
jgi:hypothetical protein